ncbi:unnamed protein product, partial [Chrysoparadoxa australica]
LETVPASFGNLMKLKRVVLECNRLRRLPETLGKLQCFLLNLNSNRLGGLPHCIKDMANLKKLLVNDNGLRSLPSDIGYSKSIEVMHLSGNRLTQLPDSLCELSTLTSLWLSHNYITGLPMNWHKLEQLTEMTMEGNDHMVYPGHDVLSEGPQRVRDWCSRRYNDRIHSRK